MFCHHCRSTTRRPKMRCTNCRNLFCDRCIENRITPEEVERAIGAAFAISTPA
ncbi:hypothetical protein EDB83DRAFT_2373169 [Lactarius deliciosus]|nr:hypothetical protein EDB83DRAFT_2373169 [Lactarius deliciosus]